MGMVETRNETRKEKKMANEENEIEINEELDLVVIGWREDAE